MEDFFPEALRRVIAVGFEIIGGMIFFLKHHNLHMLTTLLQ
jgi:hypothetical protein